MKPPGLYRGLSLVPTLALVVGVVIGSGVFLKSAIMAQNVGSPGLVMAVWVAAGVLSLLGALCFAELSALLPHAGGEFIFLREAYGPLTAFLFGWMRLVVAGPGSIAYLAVALAVFCKDIFGFPNTDVERACVSMGVIIALSIVNCAGIVFGGWVQTVFTVLKVLGLVFIVVGVFAFSKDATWTNFDTPSDAPGWPGFSAIGAAMLGALLAYDGWNRLPMVAGEVQNPERNLPRSLIGGCLIVMAIYCIANLAYLYAVPWPEVMTANSEMYKDAPSIAAKATKTFAGDLGAKLVSIAFLLSVIGALNGGILTSARVTYAMAEHGMFFRAFAWLHPTTRVPVAAIAFQAVWACGLAVSGTYDQLTDYVMFSAWIFYGLATSTLFVLRRKYPDRTTYRAPGYPFTPAIFVLVSLWLVLNTLFNRPTESIVGLGLIALGCPFYFWMRSRNTTKEPRAE